MENEMSWFAQSGPDDDIVISTRATHFKKMKSGIFRLLNSFQSKGKKSFAIKIYYGKKIVQQSL